MDSILQPNSGHSFSMSRVADVVSFLSELFEMVLVFLISGVTAGQGWFTRFSKVSSSWTVFMAAFMDGRYPGCTLAKWHPHSDNCFFPKSRLVNRKDLRVTKNFSSRCKCVLCDVLSYEATYHVPFQSDCQMNVPQRHCVPFSFCPDGPRGREHI